MIKKWLCILLLCVLDLSLMTFVLLNLQKTKVKNGKVETVTETSDSKSSSDKSFTFVGVGDNLYHGALYYQQELAGKGYNFDSYYKGTDSYTQKADLAYINFETLCLGDENYELQGYPLFNGPKEILSAVSKAGFDWWSVSSNHSLDMGADGLIEQLKEIRSNYPDVITTGSHTSQKDKNRCLVKEINGIKVGFLGYTYGLNGFSLPDDEPWLVDLIDKKQMKKDMEALSKVSDVQLVAMHWGEEYNTGISDEQEELAKYLNELGAEVIIGSHPHVIEPCEIINGEKQDTLVYYSLGNYTSAQDTDERMVGGMASFTLHYNSKTKKTTFEDTKFIPLMTWFDANFNGWRTYTIMDWNDELASTHSLSGEYDLSKEWMKKFVRSVMGNPKDIDIVLD